MHALARFWPAGIAGRIALILVTGLLVLLVIGAALHLHDRGGRTLSLFARNMTVQVAAMADLMDATTATDRAPVLAALGGPMMRVTLSPAGPDLANGKWRRPDALPAPLHRDLGDLGTLRGRPVFVCLLRPWQDGDEARHARAHRMAIAVGLRDGSWLRIRLHGGPSYNPALAPIRPGRRPLRRRCARPAHARTRFPRITPGGRRLQPYAGTPTPLCRRPHHDVGRDLSRPAHGANPPAPTGGIY